MSKQSLKKMPGLKTDTDVDNFMQEDLSQYDLSGFIPVSFEFEQETTSIDIPQHLFNALKIKAMSKGISDTQYINLILEQAVTH